MSKHTPGAVKKGWILIPCDGEAHENPRIDNCGVCAPRWGEIEVHEASFRIGQRRTAAPELLAGAKELEHYASRLPFESATVGLMDSLVRIRAAIAKAEASHV